MIRLARYFAAKLVLLLAATVVLLAIGVTLGRMLTPLLADYRLEAEQWAAEVLGTPVQIGKLRASWHGLHPSLVLKDAAILDAQGGRPSLRFSEVHIDVRLLDLLRGEPLMPHQVTFVGTSLQVKRRSDGAVVIVGLEGAAAGHGDGGGLFLLPPRLSVRDSEVYWENQAIGAAPVRLHDVEVQFFNDGDRHQLRASMGLPGGTGGRMELAADIRGALDQPGAWVGDVYLKGERLPLGTLLKGRLPPGYVFERGLAEGAFWSRWEGGRLASLEGGVLWRDVRLASGTPEQQARYRAFGVDRLGGRFRWQGEANGWRLDVDDLEYVRDRRPWPRSGLSLQVRYDEQNQLQLEGAMDFLRLGDVTAIFDIFPLPPGPVADALAGLQPRADLEQIQVRYGESPEGPRWSAQGRVVGLYSQPWRGVPGVKNLATRFQANQEQGVLDIASQDVSLDFNGLFRSPLELGRLSGSLGWDRLPDGDWRIHAADLAAANSHLETRTRIQMDLPADPQLSPLLDLQTDFRRGDVSSTHRYLPVAIMPTGVVEWLDRSLVSGRVTSGSCVVRGRLRDFPFEQNQAGRFEVLFGVEDLVLDYWPGWPRIERAAAEVRFLNNSFDTWIYGGELLDSEVRRGHGEIRDLAGASPFKFKGVAWGPFADELRLLRESPLAEDFAGLVADMRGEGNARLAVDFAIPLQDDTSPFRIDGRLTFRDSTLHLDDWQLPLTGIQGDLEFDQDGVRAKGIQARALDVPLHIDAMAMPGDGLPGTRVVARGAVTGAALADRFPGMGLELVAGAPDWSLQLDIPRPGKGGRPPVSVRVESDLVGAEIDLPPPLAKPRDEARRLYLATEFSDQPIRWFHAGYGSLLDAALRVDVSDPQNMVLRGGELRLGGAKAQLPEYEGLRVYGRLEALDLEPFFASVGGAGGVGLPLPEVVDLQVEHLSIGGLKLDQFLLDLEQREGGWQGEVASHRFSGELRIPRDLERDPLVVRLQRLALDYAPGAAETGGEAIQSPDQPDPRRFPALELETEQLIVNGRDQGGMSLRLGRVPQGLMLERLELASDELSLNANGSWLVEAEGTKTALVLDLWTEDMGQLIADLGFAQNMKDTDATIEGRLSWLGSPMAVSLENLSGEIDMQLGKGRFLQVKPGVGRIFGLLNIGALQRRLMLDFSDLFNKGFSFDRIEGRFTLDQGDAYTNNLLLESPAARIDISGRTGLVSQDFDQAVTVTPHLAGTLPLAGMIAGGPAVGAALFLAQRVMGKQVDKITRYRYGVTGPWDDPLITRETLSLPDKLGLPGFGDNEPVAAP
jgi:uncharacterized protein (TIGR02099 family)